MVWYDTFILFDLIRYHNKMAPLRFAKTLHIIYEEGIKAICESS